MRTTANPPVLAATEVFGERLKAQLELLAEVLRPRGASLERRFQARLRKLGYDPRQTKALAAITPGAVALPAAGDLPRDFVEQVEYSGRRLAKLHLPPARIMQAIEEYARLLEPALAALEPVKPTSFREAFEQWRFSAILTLNNAFYQVAEDEAQAYQELFRIELESKGLDDLLSRMLLVLSKFCRAEAAALYWFDTPTAAWKLKAATLDGRPQPFAAESVAIAARSRRRLESARCRTPGRNRGELALRPSWRGLYTSCWSVPLVFEGRLAGVMQFGYAASYEWLPREVELLSAAADHCTLAAEKARLIESLAAGEDQVRRLAERLLEVEDRERRRLSTELHDEAGQSLLCIRLQLEMLERCVPPGHPGLATGLSEARELTEKTIVEIRRLISALSPAVLEQLGLAPALRQLRTRFRRVHKAQVTLQLGPLRNLSRQTASAMYRLVQECLNNIAKHSGASRVNISLHSVDRELRLRVEDNGVGFHPEEALSKRDSFGLAGMRQRVALLGGKFDLSSRPGRGTRVLVSLPAEPRRETSDPGS
jgi:signal transduction histidine kinase